MQYRRLDILDLIGLQELARLRILPNQQVPEQSRVACGWDYSSSTWLRLSIGTLRTNVTGLTMFVVVTDGIPSVAVWCLPFLFTLLYSAGFAIVIGITWIVVQLQWMRGNAACRNGVRLYRTG
jgi:hypothetical protein